MVCIRAVIENAHTLNQAVGDEIIIYNDSKLLQKTQSLKIYPVTQKELKTSNKVLKIVNMNKA